MAPIDSRIVEICDRRAIRYTRYADDLVFSGHSLDGLVQEVSMCLREGNFSLNHKKTMVYDERNGARIVTGLLLNEGLIRLPKRARRRTRLQAHMLLKALRGEITAVPVWQSNNGDKVHVNDCVNDLLFAERVLGKLRYWSWVEKDNSYPREAAMKIRALLTEVIDRAPEDVPSE